jgi:glycosyltransferase involved in cell wall biosynthesis
MTMARPVLLAWRRYQRRSDVLAEALRADVLWRATRWKSKAARPLDYANHTVRDMVELKRRKPPYAIAQTPPHATALAPYLTRVPYVIDAHNAQFQSWWTRAPGAEFLLRRARVVLTHTAEADEIAKRTFPGLPTLVVRDPLRMISTPPQPGDWVFVVASVSPDEPLDVLFDTVEAMPDVQFTTTAPIGRLPPELRDRALRLRNLRRLGFLAISEYEMVLARSRAVLVLTDRPATQPSGACEALSAGRPLVVSHTDTTEALFGNFATLVANDRDDMVRGIRAALANQDGIRIAAAQAAWMRTSGEELHRLKDFLHAPAAT